MGDILNFALKYASKGWATTPVLYKQKKAFLHGWTTAPFPSESNLQAWFGNGHASNIGIRTGEISGNLIALDCDHIDAKEALLKYMPNLASTMQSRGRKEGGHFWIYTDEPLDKMRVLNASGQTMLDILANGAQVLVEPSVHPESTDEKPIIYKWLNDSEPIRVPKIILMSVIQHIAKEHGWNLAEKNKEKEQYREESHQQDSEIKIEFHDILSMNDYSKVGDEYVGSQPKHGSEGGQNFYFNPKRGVWHCFRCDSGGGVLSLFAVMEGIIDCHEAKSGALKGQKFLETIKRLKERFGEDRVKLKSRTLEVAAPKNKLEKLMDGLRGCYQPKGGFLSGEARL